MPPNRGPTQERVVSFWFRIRSRKQVPGPSWKVLFGFLSQVEWCSVQKVRGGGEVFRYALGGLG